MEESGAHDNCLETSKDDTAQESCKSRDTDKESDSEHSKAWDDNQQITKSKTETYRPPSESKIWLQSLILAPSIS